LKSTITTAGENKTQAQSQRPKVLKETKLQSPLALKTIIQYICQFQPEQYSTK
jgi:hypothetical protein